MQVSNIRIYNDLDFAEYCKLPGYSYSSIKSDGYYITPTPAMKFGTLVHKYLLEPGKCKPEEITPEVIKAARMIRVRLGSLHLHLQRELSFSCIMEHEGFELQYKGRIDMGISGMLIIDAKVTNNLNIEYFGYHHQLSGYCLGFQCNKAYIVTPQKIVSVPFSTQWWELQVLKFGNLKK